MPTPVDVPASATTCASTKGCFEITIATQNDPAVQWSMIGYAFADTGNHSHKAGVLLYLPSRSGVRPSIVKEVNE